MKAKPKSQVSLEKYPLKKRLLNVLIELGLLSLSSVVFALSFPSFISDWGWFPLAFISVIPVFIVVYRCSWKVVPFYGIFYGYATYIIFNYWLSTFHPMAIVIVPTIYAVYFIFVMPILKLADKLFPKYGYLVQVLIWIAYEFLRTQGFLGYPYGNIGYSQFIFLPFIQIASITGVWGVSAMVIFPSAWLGAALRKGFGGLKIFFREHRLEVYIYAGLFALTLLYGAFAKYDYSDVERNFKVALIQHNSDTWKGGIDQYNKNFKILSGLSKEAVEKNKDIEMVVWSETAFVPGIDWYIRYRTDNEKTQLIRDFMTFMAEMPVPLLTGNGHGEALGYGEGQTDPTNIISEPTPYTAPNGETLYRVDYNSVLLYADGRLADTYRKTHLVPFTENFPYQKLFPAFYQALKDKDYHFWEKGTERDAKHHFEWNGVKFSTPICYEDVFGYLNRDFVLNGAQVIVNMTNDSWSGAVSAQMQHLAMAVFRSVENRRSMLRGSNSGMTVSIEPDGEITSMLGPFTESYLIAQVPVYDDQTTIYTKFGNWFAYMALIGAIAALLFGIGRVIFLRIKK